MGRAWVALDQVFQDDPGISPIRGKEQEALVALGQLAPGVEDQLRHLEAQFAVRELLRESANDRSRLYYSLQAA